MRPALPLILAALAWTGGAARGADEPPYVWPAESMSPRPAAPTATETALLAGCGAPDGGLMKAAARLAARKLAGLPNLASDELVVGLRAEGEPHVWPRSWMMAGQGIDLADAKRRISAWAGSAPSVGQRRCGVADAPGSDGTEVLTAIAVDAVADLAPLPVRAHSGAWLAVEAKLLASATGAHVVVMGPTGLPRPVPTRIEGDRVRATVPLDRPGAFVVQVNATLANGPRPVVEGEVFADVLPWTRLPSLAVPGETATAPGGSEADNLFVMVNALRASERLAPFARDPRLDAVALAHAQRMRATGIVGHDAGDGDPAQRVLAAGLRPRKTGENVARAPSLILAHRLLYDSPGHRSNLLAGDFDHLGVAVLRDTDGTLWVVELMTGG